MLRIVKNKGGRVFDILINGKKALAGFDILQEAGGPDKALEKTFRDVAPDAQGQITLRFLSPHSGQALRFVSAHSGQALRFVSSIQDAKVCAIEIERQ